jgi:hypothetical protein
MRRGRIGKRIVITSNNKKETPISRNIKVIRSDVVAKKRLLELMLPDNEITLFSSEFIALFIACQCYAELGHTDAASLPFHQHQLLLQLRSKRMLLWHQAAAE